MEAEPILDNFTVFPHYFTEIDPEWKALLIEVAQSKFIFAIQSTIFNKEQLKIDKNKALEYSTLRVCAEQLHNEFAYEKSSKLVFVHFLPKSFKFSISSGKTNLKYGYYCSVFNLLSHYKNTSL